MLGLHGCIAHLRLQHIAAGGHAVSQPDIAADDGPFADGNAAQNRGPRIDHHVIFDDGMARGAFDHSIFYLPESVWR